MKKYHKTTIWVCDVRGCYDIFNAEKKVVEHQKQDHGIKITTKDRNGIT